MSEKQIYSDYFSKIALSDVRGLEKAESSYGSSWKKRGGIGAFMMLARKWDRIENCVAKQNNEARAYDIFCHINADCCAEGIIDDIRDLRRYLLLVEAEMFALGIIKAE